MTTQQAYADRLDAQLRAADARLDQMEAAARARNARAEMDEISGLRAQRDRVRQHVADATKELRDDAEALRRRVDAETAAIVRGQLADAHQELQNKVVEARRNYAAWREQRTDQGRLRALDAAELELEEASNRFAAAREHAEQPGPRSHAD